MDIFKAFATDEAKVLEGRWVELGEGAKVRVAREGNRNYVKFLRQKFEEHQAALTAGDEAADDLADKLILEAMSKHILTDWEGIEYKGKKVKYSAKASEEALAMPDFRSLVERLSRELDGYRAKLDEELGKD